MKVTENIENQSLTFEDFNLSTEVKDAIAKKGFKLPSEIQAKVIPVLIENKEDIIGISNTGSGKTASFGLPIVDKINSHNKVPKAIILAPTRELALQVTDELISYSGKKKLRIITVYGGASINNQISDLKRGCDIVVGTPGRILDLVEKNVLCLKEIEYFVLDEADEMLRMGFVEDIESIFESTPKEKRVLLFSATMPERIKELSKKYMKHQKIIEVKKKVDTKANIKQEYLVLKLSEKYNALCNIIDSNEFFYGIIFCMTKADVDDLTNKLKKTGYSADCIHGDINQSKREKILNKFRDLKLNILVATDVAARGIDVNDLTHVVNYSLPKENETYVHRIGRTGRAGKTGVAITFVTPKQEFMIKKLEQEFKFKFELGKLMSNKEMEAKREENKKKEFDNLIEFNSKSNEYGTAAKELIEKYGAEIVVNALLNKIKSKDNSKSREHDDSKDNRNKSDRFSRDRRDNNERGENRERKFNEKGVRLFIAKGKDNGFEKKELFNYLEKETKIKIDGESVKINGKFSFITVPKKQAEVIIEHFKNKGGSRSLVEIASEKQEK